MNEKRPRVKISDKDAVVNLLELAAYVTEKEMTTIEVKIKNVCMKFSAWRAEDED